MASCAVADASNVYDVVETTWPPVEAEGGVALTDPDLDWR